MGIIHTVLNHKKIQINEEVYQKFLLNLAQNPKFDHLRELTVEAGKTYYASKRKNGILTPEDEATIQKDIQKAGADAPQS